MNEYKDELKNCHSEEEVYVFAVRLIVKIDELEKENEQLKQAIIKLQELI